MSTGGQQPTQFQRLSVLIAACGLDMIGFAMVFPLIPFYALRFHATPEVVGLITASYSVAQLVSAPLWGRVSDRYGRRPALLIGLTASAVAYLVFGLASAVWLLFLSRVVQGAGGGTTGVAQAYVADTVKPEDRARALGWLSAATSLGVMIGPTIGSFAFHLGPQAPGFVAAGLCLINIGFAWVWLPESRKHHVTSVARKPVWHAAWSVLRHPTGSVPRFIWIYAVGTLAFSCLTSVLALYLGARFGITEKTIGYFFAYVGALSVIMRSLLLGPIIDRIGEAGAMRIGTLLLILGLALYPAATSIWTLAAILPLVPIGTALLFPSTTSLMSKASHKSEVGTTMGVAQTFGGISRVIAPIMATTIFQRLGHAMPFYVAAGIVALVSVLAFKVEHPETGQTAETPVPS